VIFYAFAVGGPVVKTIGELLGIISVSWQFTLAIAFYWFISVLAVGAFAYSYGRVVVERLRAIRIARQRIITGDLTFELLEKGLSELNLDRQILDCILHQALPTRH
jgi:hypothetical protein